MSGAHACCAGFLLEATQAPRREVDATRVAADVVAPEGTSSTAEAKTATRAREHEQACRALRSRRCRGL